MGKTRLTVPRTVALVTVMVTAFASCDRFQEVSPERCRQIEQMIDDVGFEGLNQEDAANYREYCR